MKAPSKNIGASLRGQRVGGRAGEAVQVSGMKRASAASMTIPGEGGICNPPGSVDSASVKKFADPVGGHFGGAGNN